jgi:transposase InsO family protein
MCQQLGVSRSGYDTWRGKPQSARARARARARDEGTLSVLIAMVFTGCNRPGWRRVQAGLRVMGWRVGPVRVHRLMRRLGLTGRCPRAGKKTIIRGAKPVDAPDLITRDFHADGRDQKWCGDITYIKTWNGWADRATVIDLYSRKLVGWAIADHMETSLVTAALDQAIANRHPGKGITFHSDRSGQYTSRKFTQYCRDRGVVRSLGRTGSCFDNAVAESFNATLKKELIHNRP